MGIRHGVAEVGLDEALADLGVHAVAGFLVLAQAVLQAGAVLVVSRHGREVEAAAEAAAPLDRSVEVGVAEGRVAGEVEAVARPVEVGLERVGVVDLVGDGCVQVAEGSVPAGVFAGLGEELEHPVGIGGAPAEQEGGLALDERSFEVEVAGQQADAHRAGDLVGVALAAAHVEHRGDAAAVFGGDAALVEFHFADDVGVEGREDAEQVRGVVDGAVVEQDEVLVGGAAADVEAAGRLAHGLHARQGEDGLDDVAFAEGARDLVDYLHPDALDAHHGVAVVGDRVGGDHGAREGEDLLFHHDVEHAVVPDLEGQVHVLERVTAEVQEVVADGQGQAVEAGGVGDGVGARPVVVDRHAHEGLAAGDVADVAAEVHFAGTVRAALADLVDLVLEGHHGALLGEVLLQAAVVAQAAAAVVEIAGGQGGEDGFAVQDEAGGAVAADDVAFLAQRVEGGLQELGARSAHAEGGLLSFVFDEIDVGLELAAQEVHERIQLHALDLQEVLRGQAAAQGCGQQEGNQNSSHCAAILRTALQYASKSDLSMPAALRPRRISRLRSGN